MAIYNPHKLSSKLCRVFDAGLSNVDDFARQCDLSPQLIERAAKLDNLKLDPETKFRITSTLAGYFRAHPELYQEPARAEKRGVFEVRCRNHGKRAFEVRDSSGVEIMYVEWPAKSISESRIQGLWRWLEREDPHPQLRVI